jgi:hypothetical protein
MSRKNKLKKLERRRQRGNSNSVDPRLSQHMIAEDRDATLAIEQIMKGSWLLNQARGILRRMSRRALSA